MKVLHITTSDFGGAGLCVLRIHKSLLELGVDSKVLVAQKGSDLSSVILAEESGLNTYVPPKNKVVRKFEKILRRRGYFLTQLEKYQRSVACIGNKALYTFPLSKYDLSSHPLVMDADVVHLHWISNFLDYPTFFQNVKKPIVWTLHDENIAFGGFHYRKERDKYYDLCRGTEDDLIRIKREALSNAQDNITVVALSKMMRSLCDNVPMLSSFSIETIHNSVDYKRFVSLNNNIAKQIFGIPENHTVYGFCSMDLAEERKGLKELIQALECLSDSGKVTLVCAGSGKIPVRTNLNIVKTGPIVNERIMSLFYSATNYFVLPSFQEAFAQTPIEAMSCGVPVIAFPCSGMEELINDNNGIRCQDFTVESLYEGILLAKERKYDSELIRQDVINRFSPERIAQQYVKIYKKLVEA